MVLSDCKIVDLKRSKVNTEKSDPKKNRWVFDEKRYVNRETFSEDNVWFSWCHYAPLDGYLMFEGWKMDGWEPVIVPKNYPTKSGEDPYIVEGAHPNDDGYWKFKDVVLMRCKFTDEVKRAEDRLNLVKGGGKQVLKGFARQIDSMEPAYTRGAGMGPDEIEQLMGNRYKR